MAEVEDYKPVDFRGREYLPDDFKEYVDRELNCLPVEYYEDEKIDGSIDGWVFWSREDHKSDDIVDLKTKIKDVLPKFICHAGDFVLVQFWAPIKTTEGRFSLTTQNQPFALCTPLRTEIVGRVAIKRLCEYRMICKDYKFYTDGAEEELGVPGRVFKHRLPESTPNVKYYSMREYPLRDRALRCQVARSFAVPVFEPSAQMCVGVLEFITTTGNPFAYQSLEDDFYSYIFKDIKAAGLIFSVPDADHYNQLITGKMQALDEIKGVLKEVCEVHDLPVALAWTSCKVDMACRALLNDDILFICCYYDNYWNFDFQKARVLHHIKKGQGVAWRAFSSPNVLLCKDLTQLSIIDYPLAHYARFYELSCCFAICLQSSCPGNDLYVLEFFMQPPSNIARGNSETTLILLKILETMKKEFRTFKLASGKELGEELCIEEIHFQNGEKLNSLPMFQTPISSPGPEPFQRGEEMTQLDLLVQQTMYSSKTGSSVSNLLDQQPMYFSKNGSTVANLLDQQTMCSSKNGSNDVNLLDQQTMCSSKNGSNDANSKNGSNDVNLLDQQTMCSSKNGSNDANLLDQQTMYSSKNGSSVASSKSGVKFEISLEDILRTSEMSLTDAAKTLEVSPSTLKRVCRNYGVWWPPSKKNRVAHIPQSSSDQPSSQASATNTLTIRVKYVSHTVEFPLPLSSRMVELQQQIAKRLNLEAGTYYAKYKDEEDHLILIACDDDLQDCISTSRSLGNTSILVLLEPKENK